MSEPENKVTLTSIINDNFITKIEGKYYEPFIRKINCGNSVKFVEDIITSNDQISISKELKKNKMVNDKEKLIYNNTNTTSFPLCTYRRDIRSFNIYPEAHAGGFETIIDEKTISHYSNLNLEPNSTLNAGVDKQKNRPYTTFEYALAKNLTDTSKVHFILETIAYIYYRYDRARNIADLAQNIQNTDVRVIFHDQLSSDIMNKENYNNFAINYSEPEEICHAIRAILLCCSLRGLVHNQKISIYIPTRYNHIFDRDSNLKNSPRVIDTTFLVLFRTCTSILNGVVPKSEIRGPPDPNNNNVRPVLRAEIDYELGEYDHDHAFSVNILDYYSALCIISRSFGVMYFNGRNYDGNLNVATNITQHGTNITYIPSSFDNRIAYINKFLRYKCEKKVYIHSTARLSNKLLWLVRRRFIILSEYIKWSVGSMADSALREEFGGIYRSLLNIMEHIGDNILNATVLVDGEKFTVNFLSMAKSTIHINCGLSAAEAYTRSNDYNRNLGYNRSQAWFNNQRNEPNGVAIHISDKSINHQFAQDADGNAVQDNLFLVEYCNSYANWNVDYFGSIFNEISIKKYHAEDEGHIDWNYKDNYVYSNGLIGEAHIYGRFGSHVYQIYAYANTRNVDCTYYYYPNIYKIKRNADNKQFLKVLVKSQDYLDDNHNDLYYHRVEVQTSSANQFQLEDFE